MTLPKQALVSDEAAENVTVTEIIPSQSLAYAAGLSVSRVNENRVDGTVVRYKLRTHSPPIEAGNTTAKSVSIPEVVENITAPERISSLQENFAGFVARSSKTERIDIPRVKEVIVWLIVREAIFEHRAANTGMPIDRSVPVTKSEIMLVLADNREVFEKLPVIEQILWDALEKIGHEGDPEAKPDGVMRYVGVAKVEPLTATVIDLVPERTTYPRVQIVPRFTFDRYVEGVANVSPLLLEILDQRLAEYTKNAEEAPDAASEAAQENVRVEDALPLLVQEILSKKFGKMQADDTALVDQIIETWTPAARVVNAVSSVEAKTKAAPAIEGAFFPPGVFVAEADNATQKVDAVAKNPSTTPDNTVPFKLEGIVRMLQELYTYASSVQQKFNERAIARLEAEQAGNISEHFEEAEKDKAANPHYSLRYFSEIIERAIADGRNQLNQGIDYPFYWFSDRDTKNLVASFDARDLTGIFDVVNNVMGSQRDHATHIRAKFYQSEREATKKYSQSLITVENPELVESIRSTLELSSKGVELLQWADANGVDFVLQNRTDKRALPNQKNAFSIGNAVYLVDANPSNIADMATFMAREIRLVQHFKDFVPLIGENSPEANRMATADAETIRVLVASELRQARLPQGQSITWTLENNSGTRRWDDVVRFSRNFTRMGETQIRSHAAMSLFVELVGNGPVNFNNRAPYMDPRHLEGALDAQHIFAATRDGNGSYVDQAYVAYAQAQLSGPSRDGDRAAYEGRRNMRLIASVFSND